MGIHQNDLAEQAAAEFVQFFINLAWAFFSQFQFS